MQGFFRSGDNISALEGKPAFSALPAGDPYVLAMMAADPTIRSILHPGLTGQPLRQDLLLPLWLSKAIRDALLLLMHSGEIVIGIGILLAIPAGSLWNHHVVRDVGQRNVRSRNTEEGRARA